MLSNLKSALALIVAALTSFVPVTSRAAESQGAFVDAPNGKLWVIDTGGPGIPIVLLHSNTGTVERWAKQTPAFTAAGFRVIAFDRIGSGKSVPNAEPGRTSVAEDLQVIVDRLHLSKFDLVGESGGGYVAIDYAAWHPERVRSLVIAASGGGLSDPESKLFRTRSAIPGFEQMPLDVRELSPSYRGLNPQGVAQWLEIEKTAAKGRASTPVLRTPNSLAKIEMISAPVLVLAGDVDLTTPSGAVRLWAKHLKNYEFHLIAESGHSVSWEQPGVFNKRVIDFFQRHST